MSGQISAAEMRAHIASVYGSGLDESTTAEMLKAATNPNPNPDPNY